MFVVTFFLVLFLGTRNNIIDATMNKNSKQFESNDWSEELKHIDI